MSSPFGKHVKAYSLQCKQNRRVRKRERDKSHSIQRLLMKKSIPFSGKLTPFSIQPEINSYNGTFYRRHYQSNYRGRVPE